LISSKDGETTGPTRVAPRAGLLLHPTSLPGPYGIGSLGPDAERLLEWIADAGFSVWQFLPLTPAGAGHSPYSGPSAFAANPWLISLRRLVEDGWLPAETLAGAPNLPTNRVDFDSVLCWKTDLLRRSWELFQRKQTDSLQEEFKAFVEDPSRAGWLEDWALFAALKERQRGLPWYDWDPELRRREPAALRSASHELAEPIAYQCYLQFVLRHQWRRIRTAATSHGVQILGDLPFYVAHDSADVWTHPELFQLDSAGRPSKVAGVPPDYFSETGQLWGNPIYDWSRLAESGYDWWVRRIRSQLEWTDRIRLDHFRAFEAYWEVDAAETSAVGGHWVPGPGQALFDTLEKALGGLPFVAEDLGSITEEVRALRQKLGLPGMRVLQFGFDSGEGEHLPANISPDCVAYTGTHDNDTTRGWFRQLATEKQRRVREMLDAESAEVVRRLIESAYRSQAQLVVVPMQDLLDLGSEARMNTPAVATGNWSWRVTADQLAPSLASRLLDLAIETRRVDGQARR